MAWCIVGCYEKLEDVQEACVEVEGATTREEALDIIRRDIEAYGWDSEYSFHVGWLVESDKEPDDGELWRLTMKAF